MSSNIRSEIGPHFIYNISMASDRIDSVTLSQAELAELRALAAENATLRQRLAELQARLDEMDRIQREEYPSLQGHSRLAVFPQLRQPLRSYSLAWEEEHWDLRRAQEYLAGHTALRRANVRGQVSIYNRRYSMGVGHRHQLVRVYYEVDTGEWVFLSEAGAVLRRLQATEISRARIMSLDVSA